MAENLGAVARAMGNFNITELCLVTPKCDPQDLKAIAMSAGNEQVLKNVVLCATLEEAIADCQLTYATSACIRDMHKPIKSPATAAQAFYKFNGKKAIVFGPERSGLLNDEITMCQGLIQIPVNPDFSSLNIAQAAVVVFYEYFKLVSDQCSDQVVEKTDIADNAMRSVFFNKLEQVLDRHNFWRVPTKKPMMWRNIKNIFTSHHYTHQEMKTLTGIVSDILKRRTKYKK
ncbi:MAG TPA: rRNA methyltransferase [Holosporales bacterium]|nr:rRNA methyltransferase [Holosporales bacterium]